ncbi:bifunctional diguanylate cyclase/phosphodiesterase [Pseudobacillus wudalianchiensis]|nr:EAL domain-containing protein [Bacillus wudalianchiensis]
MSQLATKNGFWKVNRGGVIMPLLFLIPVLFFREPLFAVFKEQNYITLHLIFEIFIIASSFTIAIQAWMVFPHIMSNQRLWLGALFFSISLLEVLHTITYKGMPFFLIESTPYTATWFYMVSRLTQALGLFLIIISTEKQVNSKYRWLAYSFAFIYFLSWTTIIYHPAKLLPELVVEGTGTTVIKNSLQYTAIVLQCLCIVFLIKNFREAKNRNFMMIVASLYLMIGDSMFTSYKSVYDIANFIGHLFQLLGFYFLLRALYYTAVEEPFQLLKQAEQRLRKSEESLHYMAYHDELTKLPNFRYFKEKLAELLKREPQEKTAILIIEIDRFDAMNESLGHSFSDLILQSVAARLQETDFHNGFLGKMRGKEFTLFFKSIKDKEEAATICRKLQKLMAEPFRIQHLQLNITLNMGIALYPEHGKNADELLKHAQVAKFEAQNEFSRYAFYHYDMDEQLMDRLVLEHDLHKALDKGELYLYYQPQVNLREGRIVSLEALIRWKHPERGWVSPGEFIPIAEETGLIVPIGEWVLRTACKQLKHWHNQGFSDLSVAVNLSTRQFFQRNLVDLVEDSLKKANLPPRYLELEITESMTMNVSYATDILAELKRLGVRIAIDDFGTGYSSLYYLKDLPIDCVKIDRSFVRHVRTNKHDAALIAMIISIAKHLELTVIAEGVEQVDQLEFLWKEHCHQVQGYLFSPPASSERLSAEYEELQQQSKIYCDQLKHVQAGNR